MLACFSPSLKLRWDFPSLAFSPISSLLSFFFSPFSSFLSFSRFPPSFPLSFSLCFFFSFFCLSFSFFSLHFSFSTFVLSDLGFPEVRKNILKELYPGNSDYKNINGIFFSKGSKCFLKNIKWEKFYGLNILITSCTKYWKKCTKMIEPNFI